MSAPPVAKNAHRERARERYLSALSDLVSGGLWVSTSEGADLPPERALCRVAGSLLKATMIATYFWSDDGQLGPDAWLPASNELAPHEQVDALCGIIALLQNGPIITGDLVMNDEFRESGDRIELVEKRAEEQALIAARRAVESAEASTEP